MVLLALLLCQTSGDIRDPETLGRLRAKFGEAYPRPKTDYQRMAHYYDMTMGATRMFFPAGRADRRYYVTPAEDPDGGWMVLQTKSQNRVKVAWVVDLRNLTPDSPPKTGTLERFLARWGVEVKPPVRPVVQESLKAVKPFAMYWGQVIGESFWYDFVLPDGSQVDGRSIDLGARTALPDTPYDYPITDEERKFMGRG